MTPTDDDILNRKTAAVCRDCAGLVNPFYGAGEALDWAQQHSDDTDAPLVTIRRDVQWLLDRAASGGGDTPDGQDEPLAGVRWEVQHIGSSWFIKGHTADVHCAVRIEVDVDRHFRADERNDPDVGPVAHAIRARLANTPDVVSGEEAAKLPVGSIVVECFADGTPIHGYETHVVRDKPGRDDPPAAQPVRVLYRAPAPVEAALEVGDTVEDAAELDRRATVGTIVEDQNCNFGKLVDEGLGPRWRSGVYRRKADGDWFAFPVTVVRVGGGGEPS